ncbi:hypothetical protein AAVH_15961 [Aphelenchoides avenae]|nr:hypothetical protein AAVH_15961 [Aphelenchus avenae]
MLGLEEEADDDVGVLIEGPLGVANAPPALPPAGAAQALPKIVPSKQRSDVVVNANGDEWVRHKVSKNGAKQYWRCREFMACAVRGVSDYGTVIVTRTRPELQHTHAQSPAVQATKLVEATVRDNSLRDKDPSNAAIVDNATRGLPDDVARHVKRANLLRIANDARRGHGADKVNRPLEDIEFNEAYSTTAAGEELLLWDSKRTEPGQSPIFICIGNRGPKATREP